MPSRLDRALWLKLSAKTLDLSVDEFSNMLQAGADPWVGYPDSSGHRVSLLELLSIQATSERELMFDVWLRHVGNPDGCPSGVPALHQIVYPCNSNVLDKLIQSNAAPLVKNQSGHTPLQAYLFKLFASEERHNWYTVKMLRNYTGESLSDVVLTDETGKKLNFLKMAFCQPDNTYLDTSDADFIIENGQWNLDWKDRDGPTSSWLLPMIARQMIYCEDASVWTRAGLDWAGRCSRGSTLPHQLFLSANSFNSAGEIIPPVVALCEAWDHGADFDDKGWYEWSPRERINAIKWAPSPKMDELLVRLNTSTLRASTSVVSRSSTGRRI